MALEDIADLLGHKTLAMTKRYAHISMERLHAAVKQFSVILTDTTTDTEPSGVAQVAGAVHVKPRDIILLLRHGGARGPVILPVFKAGDPSLSGVDGGFDSHTLPPG